MSASFTSPLDHLADHDCEECPLHEYTDRVCVMGDGDPDGKIMILGEAPGAEEENSGRVFSGRAGKLLDSALQSAGLDRSELYVSNVVKCRPEDNARPERVSWEACRMYLEREVERVDPSHLLLLGNTALQAVAKKSGITKQRGVRLEVRDPLYAGRTVMATIHPAYVLRNPGQQSVFTEDVRRFARAIRGEFQAAEVRPIMVGTVEGLRKLKKILLKAEVISYDVESRYQPWEDDWCIVCLGVAVDGERGYVVPLYHPNSPFKSKWKKVLQFLKPAMQRPGVKLVAQNGKFDNQQLSGAGLYLRHAFDLMLAAHLLDENRPKNLGFLSQTVLGADIYKGMVEVKPDKILDQDLRQLCKYNAYDVGYTQQLYPKLRSELIEQPRLTRIFSKLMMPASHMIQEVERVGMHVDQDRLWARIEVLQEQIDKRVKTMRKKLPEEWQEDFNFNSTQQLGRWLFASKKKGGLGLSPLEITKSGNPSTKEAVLLHYHDVPQVKALLEYRTLQLKWMNTYLGPWSTKLDARSRLHTSYKLFGTVTGRLSGDLQQVPRDDFIRSVFGSQEGWLRLDADFSQIELRIAAHVAGERRMIRAFHTGEDLHSLTASIVTGKPMAELTKEERKKAKAVNFGFLYGMYPKKFQKYAFENYQVEVSIAEAELFREKFFETYPDLLRWHERQRRLVRAKHFVQSPIGRIRHLPDILSGDNAVRMEAERQAINSPVQGCASDLTLYAMVLLHEILDPSECFMVMTLHDGIGFEVKEGKEEKWGAVIKETMENLPLKKTFGLDLSVPIVADVEWGTHWSGIPDAAGLGSDTWL